MSITTFSVRVWRWMSILALLIVLTYGYSLLPMDVGVHFDAIGQADRFMSKSDIFYIALGVVMFNNVLLMAMGNAIAERSVQQLPVPNQSYWSQVPDELRQHIKNWYYAIVAAINTLLTVTFGVLATVNNEFVYDIHSFGWLIYVVVGLLVIVVVALPIRLMLKPVIEE